MRSHTAFMTTDRVFTAAPERAEQIMRVVYARIPARNWPGSTARRTASRAVVLPQAATGIPGPGPAVLAGGPARDGPGPRAGRTASRGGVLPGAARGIPGPGPPVLAGEPAVARVLLRRPGRRGSPSRSRASTSNSSPAPPDGLTSARLHHRPEGRRTGGQPGSGASQSKSQKARSKLLSEQ